jgi:hypothetical protein
MKTTTGRSSTLDDRCGQRRPPRERAEAVTGVRVVSLSPEEQLVGAKNLLAQKNRLIVILERSLEAEKGARRAMFVALSQLCRNVIELCERVDEVPGGHHL